MMARRVPDVTETVAVSEENSLLTPRVVPDASVCPCRAQRRPVVVTPRTSPPTGTSETFAPIRPAMITEARTT